MSLVDNGFIPTGYAITEMGIVNGLLLTGVRDAYHFRRIVLTSMQCRDEHDLVPILQFVVAFAIQLYSRVQGSEATGDNLAARHALIVRTTRPAVPPADETTGRRLRTRSSVHARFRVCKPLQRRLKSTH